MRHFPLSPSSCLFLASGLGIATLGWLGCSLSPLWEQAPPEPIAPKEWPPPLDPQHVQDQDDMSWGDYHPIPGVDWTDPRRVPSVGKVRIALIAADFDDQPFVLSQPSGSDLFGNPQVAPVERADVPRFYADYWNGRHDSHQGHTINEYWMEQSHGRIGVSVEWFGPYRMPKHLFQYGLKEFGQASAAPAGEPINGDLAADCDALWRNDAGDYIASNYHLVIRVFAGYDESGVWQEFGEMKFPSPDDIPLDWGNPDTTRPRWAPTRYAPWTSWKAASMPWSNSGINVSENSGSTLHETSHALFGVANNNNNPYVKPYRRAGSGPWDLMDRGAFNGPGGPHERWQVPITKGGAMPSGVMLRQRLMFNFLPQESVLHLSREGLAQSGAVVAKVAARSVVPGPGDLAGIVVHLDGTPIPLAGVEQGDPPKTTQDRTPWRDPAQDPLSEGIPDYANYTVEVVQRIGYDSFCPDAGVLLAKNKLAASVNGGPNQYLLFNWVIDAHPEDANRLDFVRPSGEPVVRSIADYRQLNDALFHAGLRSGSRFEWEDEPNRLHFYVLDVGQDERGVTAYTVGIRSLDGAGPHSRGVQVEAERFLVDGAYGAGSFRVWNRGESVATDPSLHGQDTNAYLATDIYRFQLSVRGSGWDVALRSEVAAVVAGEAMKLPVYVRRVPGASEAAFVSLTATSESDPSQQATVSVVVSAP